VILLRECPPTAGLPLHWSDFFGREPESLETGLADFVGVPVQIEGSGTASLIIALETLKRLTSRKTVVITAYTCPLVPLAIRRCGLRIKVCDTEKNGYGFDRSALEDAVDSDTACIIPAHLGGGVCDLEWVLEMAKRRGAYVIEDAAQALGASWRGRPAGSFGDVGVFSLGVGKGLTIYKGGFLIARDPSIREALRRTSRELVSRNSLAEIVRTVSLAGYRILYNPTCLRFAYGSHLRRWLACGRPERAVGDEFDGEIPMFEVGTVRKNIGARALPRLRDAIAGNADRALRRIRLLEEVPGLEVVRGLPDSSGSWPFIMVLLNSEDSCAAALSRLWTSGLGVTKLFVRDLTGYDFLKETVPPANTPNARSFAARHLTITNSPWLRERDFERIVEVLYDVSRR
jgi:dTDP-4-amino-4,6-dideoxygalactose transaminase